MSRKHHKKGKVSEQDLNAMSGEGMSSQQQNEKGMSETLKEKLQKGSHALGDAIERVGKQLQQKGYERAGTTIERMGDKIEHMAD